MQPVFRSGPAGRRLDFRFAVRPDKILDPAGRPKPGQIKINQQGAWPDCRYLTAFARPAYACRFLHIPADIWRLLPDPRMPADTSIHLQISDGFWLAYITLHIICINWQISGGFRLVYLYHDLWASAARYLQSGQIFVHHICDRPGSVIYWPPS
jgi:hypothetical protein